MLGALGALTLAVVLAVLIINRANKAPAAQGRPTIVGWSAFWFSVVGALVLVVASVLSYAIPMMNWGPFFNRFLNPFVVSIALIFTGAFLAVAAIVRRDHHWPTWVATVIGGLGVVFWIFFAVGEVLFPH